MISSLFQPKLHLVDNFLPILYFNYVHFLRDKMQHIMTSTERSKRIDRRLENTRKQGNPVVSQASCDSAGKKDTEKSTYSHEKKVLINLMGIHLGRRWTLFAENYMTSCFWYFFEQRRYWHLGTFVVKSKLKVKSSITCV